MPAIAVLKDATIAVVRGREDAGSRRDQIRMCPLVLTVAYLVRVPAYVPRWVSV